MTLLSSKIQHTLGGKNTALWVRFLACLLVLSLLGLVLHSHEHTDEHADHCALCAVLAGMVLAPALALTQMAWGRGPAVLPAAFWPPHQPRLRGPGQRRAPPFCQASQ